MRIIIEDTIEDKFSSIPMKKTTIEVDSDDLDIHNMMLRLVKPALMAHGFSEDTVDNGFLFMAEEIGDD
jgi:hypothetical protein